MADRAMTAPLLQRVAKRATKSEASKLHRRGEARPCERKSEALFVEGLVGGRRHILVVSSGISSASRSHVGFSIHHHGPRMYDFPTSNKHRKHSSPCSTNPSLSTKYLRPSTPQSTLRLHLLHTEPLLHWYARKGKLGRPLPILRFQITKMAADSGNERRDQGGGPFERWLSNREQATEILYQSTRTSVSANQSTSFERSCGKAVQAVDIAVKVI